jgi:hypothetical protein
VLDPDYLLALLLRPGMSVYPSIDTRAETQAIAASAASKV